MANTLYLFAAEGMEGEEGKPSGTGFSQAPGSRKAPGRGVGFLVSFDISAATLSAVRILSSCGWCYCSYCGVAAVTAFPPRKH